ncbi:MAG: c-type cytochrome [Deinococcales bacterium]
MHQNGSHGGTAFYTLIAVVLGVITFGEFAIVEWQFMGAGITYTWLYILSIIKFVLVVAFFMHLWGDHKMLTQIFASGMAIGAATLALMLFLFTAANMNRVEQTRFFQQLSISKTVAHEASAGHGAEAAGHGEVAEVVMPERSFAESISRPAPKNQQPVFNLVNDSVPALNLPTLKLNGVVAPTAILASTETTTETTEASTESATETSTEDHSETTTETSTEVSAEAAASFDWKELGDTTYTSVCLACHQMTGAGIPGAFPPLKDHMPELYKAEGGREYMIDVVLYGLQGAINVAGMDYNGIMPPQGHLSDEQIAAVLNHELTSWGNDALIEDFKPIMPDEVKAQRGNTLSPAQVLEHRPPSH